MKSKGGKMFGLEWDWNTVFMGLALAVFVYTLYYNAKDDKQAGEVAVEKINEVRGEVNSRAGELEELQKEVFDFKEIQAKNLENLVAMDSRLTNEIDALKLKMNALELLAMRKSAAIKFDPVKVEPVQLAPIEIQVRYPQRVARRPDIEGMKKQVKKVTGKQK